MFRASHVYLLEDGDVQIIQDMQNRLAELEVQVECLNNFMNGQIMNNLSSAPDAELSDIEPES